MKRFFSTTLLFTTLLLMLLVLSCSESDQDGSFTDGDSDGDSDSDMDADPIGVDGDFDSGHGEQEIEKTPSDGDFDTQSEEESENTFVCEGACDFNNGPQVICMPDDKICKCIDFDRNGNPLNQWKQIPVNWATCAQTGPEEGIVYTCECKEAASDTGQDIVECTRSYACTTDFECLQRGEGYPYCYHPENGDPSYCVMRCDLNRCDSGAFCINVGGSDECGICYEENNPVCESPDASQNDTQRCSDRCGLDDDFTSYTRCEAKGYICGENSLCLPVYDENGVFKDGMCVAKAIECPTCDPEAWDPNKPRDWPPFYADWETMPGPDDLAPEATNENGLFVSPNGKEDNPGTREAPLSSVKLAVERLRGFGGKVIFVAAGDYGPLVGGSSNSIFGGYEDQNWTRDIQTNVTTIEGPIGFAKWNPNWGEDPYGPPVDLAIQGITITGQGLLSVDSFVNMTATDNKLSHTCTEQSCYMVDAKIHSDLVLLRNEILMNGEVHQNNCAVHIRSDSAAYIRDNILRGTNGIIASSHDFVTVIDNTIHAEQTAIGINDPVNELVQISGNRIVTGSHYSRSIGIDLSEAKQANIYNNDIRIEGGSSFSTGIKVDSSSETAIAHNVIIAAENPANQIAGIKVSHGLHVIVNNIIDLGKPMAPCNNSESYSCGIVYGMSSSTMVSLLNNAFFDARTEGLNENYAICGDNRCINDMDEVNGCSWGTCAENIMADPLFVDPLTDDYRLQQMSPCIDAGADPTDLNLPIDEDIDGVSRPIGTAYDIGSHEGEGVIVEDGDIENETDITR